MEWIEAGARGIFMSCMCVDQKGMVVFKNLDQKGMVVFKNLDAVLKG